VQPQAPPNGAGSAPSFGGTTRRGLFGVTDQDRSVFGGPNARERALRYAGREYGEFDEIELVPYPSLQSPPLP
jgi:hypothetical protein